MVATIMITTIITIMITTTFITTTTIINIIIITIITIWITEHFASVIGLLNHLHRLAEVIFLKYTSVYITLLVKKILIAFHYSG